MIRRILDYEYKKAMQTVELSKGPRDIYNLWIFGWLGNVKMLNGMFI